MKKNVRKAIAISGMAIAIGATGLAFNAKADTSGNATVGTHHERMLRNGRPQRWEKAASMHRVIPGIVTAMSDTSLTITKGTNTYTVNVDANTRLLNLKWASINFTDIKVGNKVRIVGTVSDAVISAKTLRDISLS